MDWIKLLYGAVGAPYPVSSLMVVALIGAVIFGGAWWLVGREYRESEASPTAPVSSEALNESPTAPALPTAQNVPPSAPTNNGRAATPTTTSTITNSPNSTVYQAGRDIVMNPASPDNRIRSLTVEVRLTCSVKSGHGELPPDEVPFMPLGNADAFLDGPAGRQRLGFVSPVRFRQLSNGKIVVINRFAVDASSDLANQPSAVLSNYKDLVVPVVTIVWGKEFDRLSLLEVSVHLNGGDPAYGSWPYDVQFESGPVFTVPFKQFAKLWGG